MRRKNTMDIMRILQYLRAGASNSEIKQATGITRKTVRRYRTWAEEQGLLTGELPDVETVTQLRDETLGKGHRPPQNVSTVEPYREIVAQLRQQGVEMRAIHQRLQERGFTGSYSAVYRFVKQTEPSMPEAVVRVECQPGQEAQVDFGYAGLMQDENGAAHKAWAFVMTLSWSRHVYVEFVFNQKVHTWLQCHRNAFNYFGGVPERVVIDNLKAAIVKACWEDPQVQMAYGECAEHYGFLIAPCRVRTPQHKGKVESDVHYVKRNFLAGREPSRLLEANKAVKQWCLETAGQRIHGTTKRKPLEQFTQIEKDALQSLPTTAYDLAVWKRLKVGRDCYVQFEQSYYSVPFLLVGQMVQVRGGNQQVSIYDAAYQLVATHEQASESGERLTHPDHLPPEKVAGVFLTRETCQACADDIGDATGQLVAQLLNERPVDKLPVVRRLLTLREAFGDARLEAACRRALAYEEVSYGTVKRILQQGLDQQPMSPPAAQPTTTTTFARTVGDLFGNWLGGVSWN